MLELQSSENWAAVWGGMVVVEGMVAVEAGVEELRQGFQLPWLRQSSATPGTLEAQAPLLPKRD